MNACLNELDRLPELSWGQRKPPPPIPPTGIGDDGSSGFGEPKGPVAILVMPRGASRDVCRAKLARQGYEVFTAEGQSHAFEILRMYPAAVVHLDSEPENAGVAQRLHDMGFEYCVADISLNDFFELDA